MTDHRHTLQIHGDNHGDLIHYNRYFIHIKPGAAFWAAAIIGVLLLAAAVAFAFWLRQPPSSQRRTGDVSARTIYEGARGGKYYLNRNGNKVYVPRDTPTTPETERTAVAP